MWENIKIGLIGYGNMAQAISDGLIRQKAVEPGQIYACAKNWEKLCKTTGLRGIHPCRDARETALCSDIVIIAVKPYLVEEVISPIREILREKIVLSVAAGYLFEQYEALLLPGTHHLSTMPNTPVAVGEGIILCENRHSLSQGEYRTVTGLLSSMAIVESVEARLMGIAGTISGCGPAYAAMFIEALGDAAVRHGLPRALAYRLASQMLVGTGKLQVETGSHPGAMKDAVCSPGGTTIVGVSALEGSGFRGAVISAIDAVQNKKD